MQIVILIHLLLYKLFASKERKASILLSRRYCGLLRILQWSSRSHYEIKRNKSRSKSLAVNVRSKNEFVSRAILPLRTVLMNLSSELFGNCKCGNTPLEVRLECAFQRSTSSKQFLYRFRASFLNFGIPADFFAFSLEGLSVFTHVFATSSVFLSCLFFPVSLAALTALSLSMPFSVI